MSDRQFRSEESLQAERDTRAMVPRFLESRGYRVLEDRAERQGQTIVATGSDGEKVTMRVRLCWRRETGGRDSERTRTYAAAQLLAKIKDNDWEKSIRDKVERERRKDITHLLLVQRDDTDIKYAALIPISEVVQVWVDQRDTSARLIKSGKIGHRKKNHAMNGSSPTLWLQDDRGGQDVAAVLWNNPRVVDLASLTVVGLLSPDDAEALTPVREPGYTPKEGDRRAIIQRQIRERRGQQGFRNDLRKRYGDRCLVTGCAVLDVLEAAHIRPYRGEEDHHVENGLILRSDVHTLFDLNLLGIDPESLSVRLHPTVKGDPYYASIEGKSLGCKPDCRPSVDALKARYAEFVDRLKG